MWALFCWQSRRITKPFCEPGGSRGGDQTRGIFSCVDCYQFLKSMTLQVFRLADMTRSGDLNMEDGLSVGTGVFHGISCLDAFMVFAISGLFCCLFLWDARNLFLGMPPSLFRRTRWFFGNCGDNFPVEKHDNFMLQLQGAFAGQIHQVHTRCCLTERDLKGWFWIQHFVQVSLSLLSDHEGALRDPYLLCHIIWESRKSVDEGVFMWGTLLSWKWLQSMESDMVNYQKPDLAISWNTMSSFMCVLIVNCSFVFQFQSDTLLVHKCSQIHPVPTWLPSCRVPAVDAQEKISWCLPHMACIEQEPTI